MPRGAVFPDALPIESYDCAQIVNSQCEGGRRVWEGNCQRSDGIGLSEQNRPELGMVEISYATLTLVVSRSCLL